MALLISSAPRPLFLLGFLGESFPFPDLARFFSLSASFSCYVLLVFVVSIDHIRDALFLATLLVLDLDPFSSILAIVAGLVCPFPWRRPHLAVIVATSSRWLLMIYALLWFWGFISFVVR